MSATVTACLAGGRIIFLDVARDRYFALPAARTGEFLTWVGSSGGALPPRLRPAAMSSGGWDRTPGRCNVPATTPIDSPVLPRVRIGPRDLVGVGRAVRSAAKDVRSKPLREILARRFAGRRRGCSTVPALATKLALFRSARPWIPVPRVCLHDCLALIDWLGPDGGGVELIFGVSALPFAAHCLDMRRRL